MAGFSIVLLLTASIAAAAVLCAAPIIVGTLIVRKTRYRTLGIVIRIIGYILTIPMVVISVIFWIIIFS